MSVRAYAAEIVERGGAQSLVQLLDSPDNWIAYAAAETLVAREDTKDQALTTLDHLADERSGNASFAADTARNMRRYCNPGGDPVEVEKRLAKIREREDPRQKRLLEFRARDGAR